MLRDAFTVALSCLALAAAMPADAACTAGNANSAIVESTPTSAFVDNLDGTVTHTLTGLMWKKCFEGFSGASCATGAVSVFHWQAALLAATTSTAAGYDDWRVPNMKELESIVERCGYDPALNREVFPTASSYLAWTSTSWRNDPSHAIMVSFLEGFLYAPEKTSQIAVRLVRGGGPAGAFDARAAMRCNLDIDGNGALEPLADGLLVLRAMFGLTGTAATAGAIPSNATRPNWTAIRTFLNRQCGTSFAP